MMMMMMTDDDDDDDDDKDEDNVEGGEEKKKDETSNSKDNLAGFKEWVMTLILCIQEFLTSTSPEHNQMGNLISGRY